MVLSLWLNKALCPQGIPGLSQGQLLQLPHFLCAFPSLVGSVQPNYAKRAVRLPRTQVSSSELSTGSSSPFQWLQSPWGVWREKRVLQTLCPPCCEAETGDSSQGSSLSTQFNLAVLFEIWARGMRCCSDSSCLVFPCSWLCRAGGVCQQWERPYLMVSALFLDFQARFPQQRAPRPLSACWGRIRTARTARVTDEGRSWPGTEIAGCSPSRLAAAALQSPVRSWQRSHRAQRGFQAIWSPHVVTCPAQGVRPSSNRDKDPAERTRRRSLLPQRRVPLLRCR